MYYSILQTKVTVLVSKSIITEDHNNDQYPVTDIRTVTTQDQSQQAKRDTWIQVRMTSVHFLGFSCIHTDNILLKLNRYLLFIFQIGYSGARTGLGGVFMGNKWFKTALSPSRRKSILTLCRFAIDQLGLWPTEGAGQCTDEILQTVRDLSSLGPKDQVCI